MMNEVCAESAGAANKVAASASAARDITRMEFLRGTVGPARGRLRACDIQTD
jgi:hypothetical protein